MFFLVGVFVTSDIERRGQSLSFSRSSPRLSLYSVTLVSNYFQSVELVTFLVNLGGRYPQISYGIFTVL